MIFTNRRRLGTKKLVTKSLDLVSSHVISGSKSDISSNSSSAITYPLFQDHTNTGTSDGYIYSSSQTVVGVIAYGFDGLNLIPDNAQNIQGYFLARVTMEDPTKDESEFQAALYIQQSIGDRRITDYVSWSSTESTVNGEGFIISSNLPNTMTEAEAARALELYFQIGYYGGMLQGITLHISYDIEE